MTATVPARLVAAAEALFADHGSENVSLRDINTAAGVANASAIQYHFGDRAGLVRAVLWKHQQTVEARRHALLDAYEAAGVDDLRALTAAYVRPLAAELDNDDGGPGFLQLFADVVTRPRPVIDVSGATVADSTHRWRELAGPLLSTDAIRHHRRFLAIRFTLTELARRGRDTRRERDDRLFVSHLIDLVTALLTAPMSPETQRIEARGRRPAAGGRSSPRPSGRS